MQANTQLFGLRAVIEALKAETDLDKIFVQKGLQGALANELLRLLHQTQRSPQFVPIEKLNRLCPHNHQGVVATVAITPLLSLETLLEKAPKDPLYLLLDGITDVRNLGAIIRTAVCTGVHGLILPYSGAAPLNGETIKTSAGGVFNLPICKVAHIKDAVFQLQAAGVQVVAATEKTDKLAFDSNLTGPIALIMGSEERGINPSTLKLCDQKIKLPMEGPIASLNVSVACGALLYEIVRQRTRS